MTDEEKLAQALALDEAYRQAEAYDAAMLAKWREENPDAEEEGEDYYDLVRMWRP